MTSQQTPISSFNATRTFMKRGTCSESVFAILNQAYGHPMEQEEHGAMPLAGGIASQGYQCGMLWGACLAAGAQAYQLFGAGARGETAAVFASQRLVAALNEREGSVNCLEITETDWNNKWHIAKFFLKGGTVSCMRRVVGFSKVAYNVINAALEEFSNKPAKVSSESTNCASELARRMGATEIQTVMAAGLAGGIGLSGGACGALGVALWLGYMESAEKPTGFSMMTEGVRSTIDAFQEATDYEYNCDEIAGQKFSDSASHAQYVCHGGCGKILAALAGTTEQVQAA
jgi:hypothetical protein